MKKMSIVAAAAGALLTTGLVASPASAGSLGVDAACPANFHPTTSGGEAAWTVECVGSHVFIDGWVKDTEADGKCAFVKAFGSFTDGSGRKEAKACPKNTVTHFDWEANGTEIRAYLYVA
ncbi:hypothetical protein OG738_38205 [Amycolatopsis sp. NBC_01488]|uniref:hypothetical protein n=1 Tax=Amycolatopsis sp. NBC_01488 TaxID=2903563 RepID=UPI002E2CB92B|nr:hypothetical protein [Amycolatopsis sp. NBC_01488]